MPFDFRKWFTATFKQGRRPVRRWRPTLEVLEGRVVPTIVAAGGQGLFITAGPGEPNDITVLPGLLTIVNDEGASILAVPPVITPAVLEGLTIAAHTSVGIGAEVEIGFDIPILPVVFPDGVLAPPLFGEIAGGATADLFSLLQNDINSTLSQDGASVLAGFEVPQDGDVYYKVAGKDSEFIDSYQLYQAIIDPADPVVDESTGYNDEALFAEDINFFNGDGVSRIVNGSFDVPGDIDYYRFTASPGERLVVILDNNPERNDSTSMHTVSGPGAAIPDNSTLSSLVSVSLPKGLIEDLDVEIDITHTRAEDLEVFLISPEGFRLELFRDVGGTGDNFVDTVLDDEATTDIADGTAPFTGTFRPARNLNSFDGLDPNGTWTLEVTDDATGETGFLDDWELRFTINNQDNDKTATYLGLLDSTGTPVVVDLFADNQDFFKHSDNISADEGNAVGAFDVTVGGTFYVAVADTGIGADNTYRFVVLKLDAAGDKVDETSTTTISSSDTPQSIPDNGSVTSTLFVGPTTIRGKITDIDVNLDITHAFDADLDVFLEHPDGTIVELFTDVGGSDDDFTGTVLDDEAGTAITAGVAPFTGSFRPEGSLSDFDSKDPRGTWKLHITDDFGGDVGTLNSWSLTITTDDAPRVPSADTALGSGKFGDGDITGGDTDFWKATGTTGDLVFSYVDTHNASTDGGPFGFLATGSIDSTLTVLAHDKTTEIGEADNGGPPGTSNDSRESLNDALEAGGVDFDALGTPTAAIITVDLGELGNDTRDNKLNLYAIQAATQFITGGRGTDEIKTGGGNTFVNTYASPDILEFNIAYNSTNTWRAGSEVDTLRVPANPGADIITIEFTGPTTFTVDVNGVVGEYDIPDLDLEQILVDAGAGDDLLIVKGIPDWMTDGIDFLGGPGDDSVVIFESDPGSLAIRRQDDDSHFGSISLGGRPSVNFEETELVTITPLNELTGETVAPGRIIVFDEDPFEFNNSILNATDFALLANAHVKPNIDDHAFYDLDDSGDVDAGAGDVDEPDEDWYFFRAPKIGSFRFDLFFEKIADLPGGGELALQIFDADKNLIVHGRDNAAGDGVSATISALKDKVYYVRVLGGTEAAPDPESINVYDLRAVEVDTLGPQIYDPDGSGDAQAIQVITNGVVVAGTSPTVFRGNQTLSDLDDAYNGFKVTFVSGANAGQSRIVTDYTGLTRTFILDAALPSTPAAGDEFQIYNASFELFQVKLTQGPTPLVDGLLINVRDLLSAELLRRAPGDLIPVNEIYGALDEVVAETLGNYEIIGDRVGKIAIKSINVTNAPTFLSGSVDISPVASATSFFDAGFIGADIQPGDLVLFPLGVNAGQIREITAFDPVDGEFTFATGFLDTPLLDDFIVLKIATATIQLDFFDPLPDDRYTLRIKDTVTDPAGNKLDGESNASEPNGGPGFPSGDGASGGSFEARFTVDSRPEIGIWGSTLVFIDMNGDGVFNPDNDTPDRDNTFNYGLIGDNIFVGNFTKVGGIDNGFDKLGAYGLFQNKSRFLLDFNGNGSLEPDEFVESQRRINGLPVAGNFDLAFTGTDTHPGDEVGVFDGVRWHLDTNGNNMIDALDTVIIGKLRGLPFIGDFDGDGLDDFATYQPDRNTFQFDLNRDGIVDVTIAQISFGQPGVLEKPVAADMNMDGIDDIGLYVPGSIGATSNDDVDWLFLVSDPNGPRATAASSMAARTAALNANLNHAFSPEPFGRDMVFKFGNSFSLPIVGNFDPPIGPRTSSITPATAITWLTKNIEKYTDDDGDTYTVRLIGRGKVSVTQSDSGGIAEILVADTDPRRSVLRIDVRRARGADGAIDVGVIRGSGLANIFAPAVNLTDSLEVASVGSLTLRSIVGADITVASLGVAIVQRVESSTISVSGSVRLFRTGIFLDSRLFAGFRPDDPLDPMAGGEFTQAASIGTFLVTGLRGHVGAAYRNSTIAASSIGNVNLLSVAADNGDQKFGILADVSIRSVLVRLQRWRFNPRLDGPQGIDDFQVVII